MQDENAQALLILELIDAHGNILLMLGCRHKRCNEAARMMRDAAITNTLALPRDSAEFLAEDWDLDPEKVQTIGDAAKVMSGVTGRYM